MRGLLGLMLAIPLAVGCGDDGGDDKPSSDIECGEGTHLEDGTCVADEDPETDADGGGSDGGGSDDGGSGDGGSDDGGSDDGGSGDGGSSDDGGSDDGSDDGGSPDDTGTDDTGTTDADGGPVGTDDDGDGVTLEDGDCDDTDATIYPGASEIWDDGIDQDCDGVADVAGSSCSADLTVTFPDGSTTTLDGCADWDFDATFEYDPDDPPEVTSFTFTLGATTEADFDCRIELLQEGVCGPGYYDMRDETSTATSVLMDCSGVSDEYESTFSSHEGYLRIDTIEAGSEAGSFAGEPLPTTLEGYLHVWTPEGIDVQGDLSLTLVQIAGDAEEESDCSLTDPADVGDADGDGYIGPYFDGPDCNDAAFYINPSVDEICDNGRDNDCDGEWDEDLDCSYDTLTSINRGLEGSEDWAYVTHVATGREVITYEEAEEICVAMGYDALAPHDGRIDVELFDNAAEVGLDNSSLVDVLSSGGLATWELPPHSTLWTALWVDSTDDDGCVEQRITADAHRGSEVELWGASPLSCDTATADVSTGILLAFERIYTHRTWEDFDIDTSGLLDAGATLLFEGNTIVTPDPVCISFAGAGVLTCEDSCPLAFDGECDDGGPDSDFDLCASGTDCTDCGPRGP